MESSPENVAGYDEPKGSAEHPLRVQDDPNFIHSRKCLR